MTTFKEMEVNSFDCIRNNFFKLTEILIARNGDQTIIHLILRDVNDNAPQMPLKADYEIDENANEVNRELIKIY